MRVGILAIQGNFSQHKEIIQDISISIPQLSITTFFIHDFSTCNKAIDAIILPGGESSTMKILLEKQKLFTPLRSLIQQGTPVLATCAGIILLAKDIYNNKQKEGEVFSLADISVQRNAYGRQAHSFSTQITTSMGFSINGLFIRAPIISRVGKNVTVLAEYNDTPVIVKQNKMLMCTFHPETLGDTSLHRYFLTQMVPAITK